MCPPSSWRNWPPPPIPLPPFTPIDWDWPPIDKRRNRAALSHQISLERKIAELLESVQSGGYDSGQLKSALLSAQGDVNGLNEYFSDRFRAFPEIYNERKQEESTIACRVFNIPELLELILEHLNIPDLLNVYQCSVSIRDSIEQSSKLQTQLSLRPAPLHSHLRLPAHNLTKFIPADKYDDRSNGVLVQVGFSSSEQFGYRRTYRKKEHKNESKDRTVDVQATFHTLTGQLLPRMGSRVRQMFVTQPPLEEMTVALDCCPIYDEWLGSESPKPIRKVSRPGGLTIGALYDRAEELLEEHRFCPQAYNGLLDNDGSVKVGVRFHGKMVLQPDDPIYIEHRESRRRREEEDKRYKTQNAKLEAFNNARKAAHTNGDPIPSLKGFVASHGDDADWISIAYPPHQSLQPLSIQQTTADWFSTSDDDPLGLNTSTAQADPFFDLLGVGTSSSTNTT